jgi:HD-like signal output (HDOD) protein
MLVLIVNTAARSGSNLTGSMLPNGADWRLLSTDSPAHALQALDREAVDVIVAENSPNGDDGARLLRDARQRRPGALRILIGGAESPDGTLRAASIAHRCLPAPLSATQLLDTIARVGRLRDITNDADMRRLVGAAQHLPSPPRVYLRLLDVLQDPKAGAAQVADVVSADPATSAKALRLCNSAYYGASGKICDIRMAVVRLGMRTIRHLVLAGEIFGDPGRRRDPDKIQRQAMTAAILAPAILGRWADAELARTAALLANVGKLIDGVDDSLHARAGALLLGSWGLPETVVEAVALHHEPLAVEGDTFGLVGAVHVATALAGDGPLDEVYLERTHRLHKLPEWRQQLDELRHLL